MKLIGGPLAYESQRPPEPLSEEEEAALAFAACVAKGAPRRHGEDSLLSLLQYGFDDRRLSQNPFTSPVPLPVA